MANTIFYACDPKESKVAEIKIDFTEPNNLEPLARVAKIHIPVVEALAKKSVDTLNIEDVIDVIELDLPNLPVTLRVGVLAD